MSNEQGTPDYWASALAEVEAEIAKLQAHADFIRERIARSGGTVPPIPTGGSPAGGGPNAPGGGRGGIKHDSFLSMTIPEATKKLLEMTHVKHSTQEVIDALVKGGMPSTKYNTMYSILSRRERQVGDIISMKGDWALADWYPNHRPKRVKSKDADGEEKTGKKEKATA